MSPGGTGTLARTILPFDNRASMFAPSASFESDASERRTIFSISRGRARVLEVRLLEIVHGDVPEEQRARHEVADAVVGMFPRVDLVRIGLLLVVGEFAQASVTPEISSPVIICRRASIAAAIGA